MRDIRKIKHLPTCTISDGGISFCADAYSFLEGSLPHQYEAVITDPPYEISIGGEEWDTIPLHIDWLAYQFHRVLKPGGNVFVFCSDLQFGDWYRELSKYFFKLRKFAWCKTDAIKYNKGSLQEGFELGIHACAEDSYFDPEEYYFNYLVTGKCGKGERIMPDPDERQGTAKGDKSLHKTQKALSVIELLVTALTKEGDTILDPFSGTGTLAVAAKKLGRKYTIVEFNHRYYLAHGRR